MRDAQGSAFLRVKITPAHDPNDFEVGLRHGLPVVRVMNDDGTMNELAGKYAGLDRYECRNTGMRCPHQS